MTLPKSRDDLQGLRAARWSRESTPGQTDRSGPAAQRLAQDEAIERLGLVHTEFAWIGSHSGFDEKAIQSSEQWVDMLRRAGRDFDVLVVAYASRFCRNGKVGRVAMDQLHSAGAAVYFVEDDLLILPSKADQATERWFAIMLEDEMYSRKLVRAMERTYRTKFKTHSDPGGMPPLGFRRSGGSPSVLQIDPASIGSAVRVFELYGLGTYSAERLARATGLHVEAIKPMLRNRVYNGWVQRYGQWIPAAWREDPPVSDELWERCAGIREARTRGQGPRRKDHPDLLDGLLYCVCGQRLWSDGMDGAGQRRKRHRGPCPRWGQVERLRAATWEVPISAQLARLDLSARTIAAVASAFETPLPMPNQVGAKQIERDRGDLAGRYAKGLLTEGQFLAEAEALRHREQALQVASAGPDVTPELATAYLRDLGATWAAADPQARADLAHAVYERIEVVRGEFKGVTLTPEAESHGLARALPEQVVVGPVARVGGEGLEPPTFSV